MGANWDEVCYLSLLVSVSTVYLPVQIEQYSKGERDVPLLIVGSSGSGKSSILAAAAVRSLRLSFLFLFNFNLLGRVAL